MLDLEYHIHLVFVFMEVPEMFSCSQLSRSFQKLVLHPSSAPHWARLMKLHGIYGTNSIQWCHNQLSLTNNDVTPQQRLKALVEWIEGS